MSHGRLQPVGDSLASSTVLERVPGNLGAPLNDVNWQMYPSWTVERLCPPCNFRTICRAAQCSEAGVAVTQKKARSPLQTSLSRVTVAYCCLLCTDLQCTDSAPKYSMPIPVTLVTTIPMQNGDLGWQFWKIRPSDTVSRLRVIARDDGSGQGQWLGIAQPSRCQSDTR